MFDYLFANDLFLSRWSPSLSFVSTEQNFFESLTKDFVEDRVEYRIYHRTGVTEPSDEIEYFTIYTLLAIRTNRGDQIQYEKRSPQYDKSKKHYTQHFCCFLLLPYDPTVSRTVSRNNARGHRAVALRRGGR